MEVLRGGVDSTPNPCPRGPPPVTRILELRACFQGVSSLTCQAWAAGYLTLAGDRATRAFANQDALKLYRRASEHARALGARGAQWRDALVQIDERRGDVLERTGAHELARAAYESALGRVDDGDRVWRARLQRLSAKTWETEHNHVEAQRAYDRAMGELGAAPPAAWRAHEPWYEGVAAPDESPDAWWREWVQVQVERVLMYYWDADVQAMTTLVERVRDAVDRRGTPTQRARFHIAIVQNDLRRARYRIAAETVRHARAAVEASEEARDSELNGYARFAYAFTLIFSGNWQDGEREIRAALAQSLKVGDAVTQQRCRSYLTTVLRFCGKQDEVRKENESFLKISKASNMRDYEGVAHANLAWLAWRAGDVEATRKEAAEAFAIWDELAVRYVYPMQWMARLPAAGAALRLGRVEEAAEFVKVLLDPGQHHLPDGILAALGGAISAWDAGRRERCQELLEEALRVAEDERFL